MSTITWQTWVEMHPETAAGLGLKDGDVVKVISPAGEVEALAHIYPGIGEGVVAMPTGRGHDQYGRYAQGNGSNPIRLVVPAVEGDTASFAGGSTRVRLEPAGRAHRLAQLGNALGVEYLRGEDGH
jgi:molybdopterin-containing oxidoreductase family iron-sulfur binding subunit